MGVGVGQRERSLDIQQAPRGGGGQEGKTEPPPHTAESDFLECSAVQESSNSRSTLLQ